MRQHGIFAAGEATRRLTAALWILCAALALQLAATGEGVSHRPSGKVVQGRFSALPPGERDPGLTRSPLRLGKLADLRFAERGSDLKQALGGPEPLIASAGPLLHVARRPGPRLCPPRDPGCPSALAPSRRARAPPASVFA
ncbi:hypothetical protein [Ensifer soli]|uniref:hypothetical protein n=1 Tax=Ciceribacter sp. sgz301302 TaxID=3342379 RepID=UPI0035B8A3FD